MISYLKSSFVKPDDNICCPDPKHWAILVNEECFFSPKGCYLILFFAWYLMCIANCGKIIQLTNCGVFWNLKNWKVFYVDQTAFLENGNITPRAFLVRFEIWKVLRRLSWKNEASSPERNLKFGFHVWKVLIRRSDVFLRKAKHHPPSNFVRLSRFCS